jgi:hypothetical protein
MFAYACSDFTINNASVNTINGGSTGDYEPESSNYSKFKYLI